MTDTRLQKVQFQGGINKNTSRYNAENWWVAGDKVRFRNGRPEKIGGWSREVVEQVTDTSNNMFTGISRDIHTWTDLSFKQYFASASHKKVEQFNGGQIYDITPYRATDTLNNAITTVSTESEVTITDTNHGVSVGDFIFIDSQVSAVDGVTLAGEYTVVMIVDADNFKVDSATVASGSTALGGGDLVINYLLECGEQNNGNTTGYGGGSYNTPGSAPISTINLTDAIDTNGTSTLTINDTAHGLSVGDEVTVVSQASAVDGIDLSSASFTGDFEVLTVPNANSYTIKAINNVTLVETVASGTTSGAGGALSLKYGGEGWDRPRAGVGGTFLRQWSLDNWGEDLIACVRQGKLYQWDATSGLGSRLEQITNAPVENYMALVAQPSRHLVVFGTIPSVGGSLEPLTIRWAEQESLTGWAITPNNTAGEYRLPLGNYIVSVVQTKSEIIIFTDTNVYSMRYVGGADIFSFDIIANNVTAVGQHCGIDTNGIVYWMGIDNFYMYDGIVRVLDSTLEEAIFDQDGSNRLDFEQKEKTFCATNNEFSEILWLFQSEGATEVDRYVIYNFKDRVWYDGTLDRTVWLDRSIYPKPYSISSSGLLYAHEQGKDDDGEVLAAFIESGDIDLGEGEEIMFVDRFVPDFNLIPNRNANLYLKYKMYPSESGVTKGPYVFNNDTKQISLRVRGRHVSVKYEVNALGSDFEVGAPRFGIKVDGER